MLIALVVHIALAVQDRAHIDANVLRIAIAETAAIWAPYGLVLLRVPLCDEADGHSLLLDVDIVDVAPPCGVGVVLGAIVFRPTGRLSQESGCS